MFYAATLNNLGFGPDLFGDPAAIVDDSDLVVSVTTTAPRTLTARELAAKISAAGGSITVAANSSESIVARNESWQFSIIKLADGSYKISHRNFGNYYLIGGALLILLVIAGKR